MARIHWAGVGLSAIPGIRRLIEKGRGITLWNRTVAKAEAAVEGLQGDFDIRPFSKDDLKAAAEPGDVIVSMLPANWHLQLAEICLEVGAHFVSSSYISDEMRALDGRARYAGLCFVNEVGLDPGLDHLLAHALMADYRASPQFDKTNAHEFRSYCGGFPKIPNAFRYKFSWSPVGVLKALKSPARSIRGGAPVDSKRPWDALSDYRAVLPDGEEVFEVYPNRDSLPFMPEYGFAEDWNVQEFVRGTLRLGGWAEAWADIFREVEGLRGEAGEQRLQAMSKQLWAANDYEPGEPDRVVLCVELRARREGRDVWHKSYALDAAGNASGSAMARLVSTPVSLAIEAVLDGKLTPGVSAAPNDPALIAGWLDTLRERGERFELIDHLAL